MVYIMLTNLVGGECNPLPAKDDEDPISQEYLVNLIPEQRITVQNKCWSVKELYQWI